MVYERIIQKDIDNYVLNDDRSILFIWGPRRSGKTTILEELSKKHKFPIFNFDNLSDQELFIPRTDKLEKIAKSHKLILIDEVQSFPESTVALKILHDEFKIKIIATGSSELRQKSADFDSLAGRFTELYCLPLSLEEKSLNDNSESYRKDNFLKINDALIYGGYPEIYSVDESNFSTRVSQLERLIDTYILKDVINIYDLKNAKLAKDILTNLALQLGSELSYRELSNKLDANIGTVTSYLEIFIKNYVLISLPSFKTNARRAVSQNKKFFFYDLGIRNAFVKDFRDVELRPDKGGVFENLVISEIDKMRRNHGYKFNMYFYREYSGKEIDLVLEDYKKNYFVIEIKLDETAMPKDIFPLKAEKFTINRKNFYEEMERISKLFEN